MDQNGMLYDMDTMSEEKVFIVNTYSTASFYIELKHEKGGLTKAEDFVDKLQKIDKFGEYKIPQEEWTSRMMGFIVSKMKANVVNPTGTEFEGSKNVFFNALFRKHCIDLGLVEDEAGKDRRVEEQQD